MRLHSPNAKGGWAAKQPSYADILKLFSQKAGVRLLLGAGCLSQIEQTKQALSADPGVLRVRYWRGPAVLFDRRSQL